MPPSLEVRRSWLHMVLLNRFYVALLEQGAWTRWPPEAPSNLDYTMTQ